MLSIGRRWRRGSRKHLNSKKFIKLKSNSKDTGLTFYLMGFMNFIDCGVLHLSHVI
jgi:hypothetical protein